MKKNAQTPLHNAKITPILLPIMAENLEKLYEHSLHLVNQLSAEVQADIKESREFRQEMREDREESRKDREESRRFRQEMREDREESRKDREESRRFRQEMREDREESRKDREESRKDREESRKDREKSRKDREESGKRMDRLEAMLHEFIEHGKRLSEESAEDDRKLKADMQKLAKSMEQTGKRLESFGIVQGQVAEDLFYRNLPVLLKAYHIAWSDLHRNIIGEKAREYDLAAINSSTAFVFEVKNKLRLDDIKRFHEVQLPDFKPNFPNYANHTVYGGIGALVVREDLQRYAKKLGLFVLTQGENENARLHTPQKPLEF